MLALLVLTVPTTQASAVTLTLSTSNLVLRAGATNYAQGFIESLAGIRATIDSQGENATLTASATGGGTLSEDDLKIRCSSGVATNYESVSTPRLLWTGQVQGPSIIPLDIKVDNLRSYSSGSYSQTLLFTVQTDVN